MPDDPSRTRVLFVDDEANIRLTFSAILEQQGFETTAVATVAAALREINTREFNVLISDLNIGEPGDGFTVVSAMRRTQPHCVNFILTGYPAFEAALQTLRSHVDDYLVKPANITDLVDLLKTKLSNPKRLARREPQHLPDFLLGYADEIVKRALSTMKANHRIAAISLTDNDLVDHLPGVLAEIIQQLKSQQPDDPTAEVLKAGMKHGGARKQQGYSQEMLVDDIRALDVAIFSVVQDHLLDIMLSNLIPDLSRVNTGLEAHLQMALRGFSSTQVP